MTFILSLLLMQFAGLGDRSVGEVDFNGEWFSVGDYNVSNSHWTITEGNQLVVHYPDPEVDRHFTIVRTLSGRYILESEEELDHPDIGTILTLEPDRIEFSDGLIMTRLTRKTDTPFSVKEFNAILSASIWQYELMESSTTLYLSDSLDVNGWQRADIVKTGKNAYAGHAISWGLQSHIDQFVLHHVVDRIGIVIILIDTADDTTFSGRAFYNGLEQQVVARRVAPASTEHIQRVSSILTGTEWIARIPIKPALSEMDTLRVWWKGYTEIRSFGMSGLDRLVFEFSFISDHTVRMTLNGDLTETYRWFISKDGKYIIIPPNRSGTFFAELDQLNGKPPKLHLVMDYDLEYPFRAESDSPEGEPMFSYLVFELEAQ